MLSTDEKKNKLIRTAYKTIKQAKIKKRRKEKNKTDREEIKRQMGKRYMESNYALPTKRIDIV